MFALAAALVVGATCPASAVQRTKLLLTDGQSLTGEVVEERSRELTLRLPSGATVTVSNEAIRDRATVSGSTGVDPADSRFWRPDPNRTRYIYVPSAMFLRPGEAYISQKQLALTTAALGITDWFNVLVGSVLPAWFAGADGFNFMAAAKVGTSFGDYLHVNAGGELLFTPGETGGLQPGFVFGGLTFGNTNNHITLTAGMPSGFYRDNFFQFDAGSSIVIVAASLRVSDALGLVSENWVFPSTPLPSQTMVNAVAMRFIGERYSFDVGLVRFLGYSYPLPWLDFTWTFEVPWLQREGKSAKR